MAFFASTATQRSILLMCFVGDIEGEVKGVVAGVVFIEGCGVSRRSRSRLLHAISCWYTEREVSRFFGFDREWDDDVEMVVIEVFEEEDFGEVFSLDVVEEALEVVPECDHRLLFEKVNPPRG